MENDGDGEECDKGDRPSVTVFDRDALVCPFVTFSQACWMFGCRRSLCIAKEKNYFFSFASYVMVTLALTQIFAARMTVAASSACSVIMPLAEKLLAPLS